MGTLQGSKRLKPGLTFVVAEVAAEKFAFRPSGVKTPQEIAGLMSCLKAQPTKLKTFSATSEAATHKPHLYLSAGKVQSKVCAKEATPLFAVIPRKKLICGSLPRAHP